MQDATVAEGEKGRVDTGREEAEMNWEHTAATHTTVV